MDIVSDTKHARTPTLRRSLILDTITGNVLFTISTDAQGFRPNEGITYLMDASNVCIASIDWIASLITVNGHQISIPCFFNTISWTPLNNRYASQPFVLYICMG